MGFYAPAQIVRDAVEHGVTVLPADVNESAWDCTLVTMQLSQTLSAATSEQARKSRNPSLEGGAAELGEPEVSLSEAGRVIGISTDTGRLDSNIAIRLGLRQIDGLPEAVAARLIAERDANGPFADVMALRDRTRIGPAHIERLAGADAFGSMGLSRRQALWDARSLVTAAELPLFAHARRHDAMARDEGAEKTRVLLPQMPLSEEVVADYQTTRLSLKAHPMAFLRASLADRGFVRACDLRARKFRSMVHVAGVVLIRQRPGSAKGVCFITLEDETGVINLVVWPDLKEKQRRVVMGSRLMEVRGRVEYDDEVIHVIAHHMTDASQELYRLSEETLQTPIARADHCNNPLPSKLNPRDDLRTGADDPYRPAVEPWQEPAPGNRECGYHGPAGGHPRDVRIMPPSRDFH